MINSDGHSSCVTSIAIRNLESGQTKSFSIHQYAEQEHITPDQIIDSYDTLEKKMLKSFYAYIKQYKDSKWIHWNMRGINYGFEAIAHRYKVLGGTSVEIVDEHLIDLARLLVALYSSKYIGYPRLEKLINHNRITNKDFLTGKEEAEAFVKQQYVKLHQSTLRKVDIFSNIIGMLEDNSLHTKATWRDQNKIYPQIIVEYINKHWVKKAFAIVVIIAGIIGIINRFF